MACDKCSYYNKKSDQVGFGAVGWLKEIASLGLAGNVRSFYICDNCNHSYCEKCCNFGNRCPRCGCGVMRRDGDNHAR